MLSPEDFAQLDNRYVLKDDCNERHAEATKEITELMVQQTKINTQLGLLIKINSVMLTAVATTIVGAIMKLIVL